MSESVVVTFDRKSYTFDGKYWYGTADYMTPPREIVQRLTALLPATPVLPTKPPAKKRRLQAK